MMQVRSSTLTGDQSNDYHWIKRVSDVSLIVNDSDSLQLRNYNLHRDCIGVCVCVGVFMHTYVPMFVCPCMRVR